MEDNKIIKKGFDKQGNQRYLNKETGKIFTLTTKTAKRFSDEVKEKALQMYLECMSVRAISRLLDVSHVSVLKWIKKAALSVEPTTQPSDYVKVELDEMWHFIKKKNEKLGSG